MGEIGEPLRDEPLVVPAPAREPIRVEPSPEPVKVPEREPVPV